MLKNFGQLLFQKRNDAKLSITDLAKLSGLSETTIESFEEGHGELPNFDTCYRLGQIISSRSGQMFVLQDLWQALRADKLENNPSAELFFVQ